MKSLVVLYVILMPCNNDWYFGVVHDIVRHAARYSTADGAFSTTTYNNIVGVFLCSHGDNCWPRYTVDSFYCSFNLKKVKVSVN